MPNDQSRTLVFKRTLVYLTSGYGSQTAMFTPKIKALGYDVALSCFFGLEGGMHSWRDMLCYPTDATRFGGMLMSEYAAHHGDGDPLNTLVITLQDVWPLMLHNPAYERLAELRMLSWTPVDHDPVPPMVAKFLKDTGPTVVALSRHGQAAFEKEGIEAEYVPHGIDPDVFKPNPDIGAQFRDHSNIPQDAFVVGMVANNQGLPSRKAFPQVFQAFAKFAEKRKDAILYVHCDVFGRNNGVNLIRLAKACGIGPERMRTSEQLMLHLGIAQPLMSGVFNSFDVLCMPSLGEGFGIPLIEAQACGVPVVTTEWTAMTELCGAGWLVGGDKWWDESQAAWQKVPNVKGIHDALVQAYKSQGSLSKKAAAFAEQFQVDKVMELWKPVLAEATRPREVAPLKVAA